MWVFLLLISGIASATDTPITSAYRSFEGGFNDYSASISLAPNESPNLMNVVIDEPLGALTQRNGFLTCGTTPSGNTATSLFEYTKNDGSRNLIVSDNASIWHTADCVNFSTITTGQSATSLFHYAIVRDNLWAVNGTTWPIVWNGTTASLLDGHSASTPTGPKGKYIVYWKSRVWIGNTTTQPSGVYFSALVDSDGNELNPATSTGAWSNTNNVIYFNRDSGSPLYGLKVYRDNMYAFKENAILRLVFENEFLANGIEVTKSVSHIGSKFQDSIVEMDDGLLRFVGNDGVYAFDGSMVKRISTKWTNTFQAIKQPSHSESYKLWDTASDWLNGTLSGVSTSYLDGSLSLDYDSSKRLFLDCTAFTGGLPNNWTLGGGTKSYSNTSPAGVCSYGGTGSESAWIYRSTETSSFGNWSAKMGATNIGGTSSYRTLRFYFISTSSNVATANGYYLEFNGMGIGAAPYSMTVSLNKIVSGVASVLASTTTASTLVSSECGGGLCYRATCNFNISRNNSSIFTVTSTDCANVSISATDTSFTSGNKYAILQDVRTGSNLYKSSATWDNIYITGPINKSGTFTSQVATATSLTQWSTIGIDEDLDSQTISYSVRLGSTAYNANIADWNTITPGTIISSSTYQYYQLKASLSTTDESVSPLLNSMLSSWVTGDTTLSPLVALPYKSRYWMSASTTAGNSYNDLVMVESKTPLMTYTKFNLPVSAMAIWNNQLYGAISNTSKIARLDYGDTDDGAAIESFWDSRDEVYDNPIFSKSINRMLADYSSTPLNTGLKIGLSNDMGSTYTYRTISTYSTLPRATKIINQDANRSTQFRSRIYNNTLGVGFKLYGIHTLGTMSDFYGN